MKEFLVVVLAKPLSVQQKAKAMLQVDSELEPIETGTYYVLHRMTSDSTSRISFVYSNRNTLVRDVRELLQAFDVDLLHDLGPSTDDDIINQINDILQEHTNDWISICRGETTECLQCSGTRSPESASQDSEHSDSFDGSSIPS